MKITLEKESEGVGGSPTQAEELVPVRSEEGAVTELHSSAAGQGAGQEASKRLNVERKSVPNKSD